MKIIIADYGMGNLLNVQKAFAYLGYSSEITQDPEEVAKADKLVLPGVGAFGSAMSFLKGIRSEKGRTMREAVLAFYQKGTPLLGICLGMQLLFEESEEYGCHQGLGIISGRVVRFPDRPGLKVPQMGWNSLLIQQPDHPLLRGIPEGSMVYFVHSYYCVPSDYSTVLALTEYGLPFCSVVGKDNVMATQFHPEKSGQVGLQILRNFAEI